MRRIVRWKRSEIWCQINWIGHLIYFIIKILIIQSVMLKKNKRLKCKMRRNAKMRKIKENNRSLCLFVFFGKYLNISVDLFRRFAIRDPEFKNSICIVLFWNILANFMLFNILTDILINFYVCTVLPHLVKPMIEKQWYNFKKGVTTVLCSSCQGLSWFFF